MTQYEESMLSYEKDKAFMLEEISNYLYRIENALKLLNTPNNALEKSND